MTARAAEYSKAATKGQWNAFDRPKAAKVAAPVANEDADPAEGGLFGHAGVAAE